MHGQQAAEQQYPPHKGMAAALLLEDGGGSRSCRHLGGRFGIHTSRQLFGLERISAVGRAD